MKEGPENEQAEENGTTEKLSKFHWMEKTKAYDRAGLERGFKDKEFETKENADFN